MAVVLATALYRFDATQPGDLSFQAGEIITVLQQSASGWWTGKTEDGRVGIFPYNRVKILDQNRPLPPLNAIQAENLGTQTTTTTNNTPQTLISRVNSVGVAVEEAKKGVSAASFKVEASTSDNKVASGVKDMREFRILLNALNQIGANTVSPINGQFLKKSNTDVEHFELSMPEWSDLLPLERSQLSQRATQLETFLNTAIGESEMDYLIVFWLDPRTEFNVTATQKAHVAEVLKTAMSTVSKSYGKAKVPKLARAAFDWSQRDDQEINLFKHEILAVLDENTMYAGWWLGQKANGKKGLFPYNYVQILSDDMISKLLNPNSDTSGSNSPNLVLLPMSPKMNKPVGEDKQEGITQVGKFENLINKGFTGSTLSTNFGQGRLRKRITKYSLCCTEAFDELLQNGVTIEENGQIAKFQGRNNTPKVNDTVLLLYSAYIWEPQKQELLEFASSDVLFQSGKSKKDGRQGGPLEFTMGKEEAIEGVEEAVARMEIGQSVRVTLTPEKGYGDVGYPPDIPGNAYLVYDLNLIDLKKNVQSVNKGNIPGVVKSAVANRKPSGSFKDFPGFRSIADLRAQDQEKNMLQSKRRMKDLGAGGSKAVMQEALLGVDSEAFKKKLTLKKLQEIVRKRQYEEYGIIPGIIEEYLTDEEFQAAFNVDHFTWLLMPAFKRKHLKQQLGLF